jgi:glycerol kinase
MKYVGAIDQGTTSSRFMIFDKKGEVVASHQMEHEQILPQSGWVEHNPVEIINNVKICIDEALRKSGISASDLASIGITNQRETVVAWDKSTGAPLYNAIVWQDLRTQSFFEKLDSTSGEYLKKSSGLALAPYFSGSKMGWLISQVPTVATAHSENKLMLGTIDSWLLWNLSGGVFATDVTNASRTMVMNIETAQWDSRACEILNVPIEALPQIKPSGEIYGHYQLDGAAIPIAAMIGDQQSAMVGQKCFEIGSSKTTYGTGNFALVNTGTQLVRSTSGLLTTVCYQFKGEPLTYALEGSVAVTGSAIQWLRDQLGIISEASEVEALARSVDSTEGVYFVPAFSGLFAPHWRSDARGVIVGLTRATTKAHIARAALEAICYQTREILDAMSNDMKTPITQMRVDGGITANALCMQIQAEIMQAQLEIPAIKETTALGAALCAGLAVGFWSSMAELKSLGGQDQIVTPMGDTQLAGLGFEKWKKAVSRTLDWA